MTAEIIEGEAVEIPTERAVVVRQQPGQALVTDTTHSMGARDMVAVATDLADALKDIVERQRLYATIQGKKYPQVEAWMTIARMDNVVCREVTGGITRHDDGSYEAAVELIRLSDGMVIGHGSALCGTSGDSPWDKRPEPARRSMAVTRATSRAFRQQYSWIMALAGYEPTPAEEMPRDEPHTQRPAASPSRGGAAATTDGPWAGAVEFAKAPADGQLRETPDGWVLGFVLLEPNPRPDGKPFRLHVLVEDALAQALAPVLTPGVTATVHGQMTHVPFDGDPSRTYRRVIASRVSAPTFTLPAAPGASTAGSDQFDDLPW